ncbi:MAG: wax ester/triacylglycerol synthase family O-acyltransferase [Gammaproteobacteria bacterium]|nr:wax ester/triacylglycerol synthase family O-acyltransferase [Gammaproteobacteria bacterium]
MQQLSGLDALFLTLESDAAPMHVGGVSVLDLAHAPAGFAFDVVRARIGERLRQLPHLRRRLVQMPLNLVPPFWIEDPGFRLDAHVRRLRLPPPGRDAQLAERVAALIARPLPRNRPLWACYYIEGLSRRRAALVTIIHHACVDGVSGAELLGTLLDLEPLAVQRPVAVERQPDQLPTDWARGWLALRQTLGRLRRGAGLLAETAPLAVELGREWLGLAASTDRSAAPSPAMPRLRAAPRTRFNCTIGAQRSYACGRLSLARIKQVKTAFGVSVNDVVLAVCAGALREELGTAGELPDESLLAAVPMSVRAAAERGAGGNRVTMLRVCLHTQIADPRARIAAIAGETARIKQRHRAVPARLLMDWMEVPAPALLARAARLYENFGVQDLIRPPFNLVISNVPGPSQTLYLAGAPLLANYPISIPYHGLALNVTVLSYRDWLDVGVTAWRQALPRPQRFLQRMAAALEQLAAAADLTPARKAT